MQNLSGGTRFKCYPGPFSSVSYIGNELKPTDEEVDIQPRIFSNEVQIQNYQQLKSLEIYRADGKLIRSIPQPGSSLSTGDFATGMYIFRLTTEKGSQTVQGIKK